MHSYMKHLDHIECTVAHAEATYPLFLTITLPKCHYRKKARKQNEVMNRALPYLFADIADKVIGVKELTMKGNIHAHMLLRPRIFTNHLTGNPLSLEDTVKIINNILKGGPISDLQIVKKHENVLKYLWKDIDITRQLIEAKPCFLWCRKISEEQAEENLATKLGLIQSTVLDAKAPAHACECDDEIITLEGSHAGAS